MNDFTTILLVLALPPAAIEFLALVWAKGRLRLGLAIAVPLIPLGILGWLMVTAASSRDDLARLGWVALAVVLFSGAVTGAVLAGIVLGLRRLKRKRTPQAD